MPVQKTATETELRVREFYIVLARYWKSKYQSKSNSEISCQRWLEKFFFWLSGGFPVGIKQHDNQFRHSIVLSPLIPEASRPRPRLPSLVRFLKEDSTQNRERCFLTSSFKGNKEGAKKGGKDITFRDWFCLKLFTIYRVLPPKDTNNAGQFQLFNLQVKLKWSALANCSSE